MTGPLSWVVGAGGLLGSNTATVLARRGPLWSPSAPIRWNDEDILEQLTALSRRFGADAAGRAWQVAWCAGSGSPSATSRSGIQEASLLEAVLNALAGASGLDPSTGGVFVASSAGGVYAGSHPPPFTESSPTSPISPYGEAKLELEHAATRWSVDTGTPLLIGRISNIYGPGQNLAKPQGLISQVCRAYLLGRPISIYVPLSTLRDYIYSVDCGILVADSLQRLRSEAASSGETAHVKIIATQRSITISLVLAELRRIFKRAPRIVFGSSTNARYQVPDLSLRSQVWADLDKRSFTPLPAGIKHTVDGMARALQAGRLA